MNYTHVIAKIGSSFINYSYNFNQIAALHPQLYEQLTNERNTWRLLGSIYQERLSQEEPESPSVLDLQEPLTDLSTITKLFDTSCGVREAQLVIDWLERNAADKLGVGDSFYSRVEYFGDTHIGWENTLKVLKNGTSGVLGMRGTTSLVNSMDPDAPLREGKTLHDLDQEDEKRLLKHVFAHLLAGQVSGRMGYG